MPNLSTEFWIGSILAVLLSIIAFGVGVGMDSKTKGEYWFVICCFCVSWLVVVGMVGLWDVNTTTAVSNRALVSIVFVALASFGLFEALRWAGGRHERIAGEGAVKSRASEGTVAEKAIDTASKKAEPVEIAPRTKVLPIRQPPIERVAKFTVMIPFDTTPGAFPVPTNDNFSDPLSRRYSEFYWMAWNGTIPQALRETTDNGQVTVNSTPVSLNDSSDFLARLLQYDIFHNIDMMQHDSMTVTLGAPMEANAGVDPPDAERYSYEQLFKELENNYFYRPFLHRPSGDDTTWKMKPSKFPKGIQITFPTDTADKPNKYIVRFHRPHYYEADFIVEAFMGTGVGQPPKNFVSKNASMIMQWSFLVKMHYRIEHPDDEEFNPGIYAQWLDALYDGLKKRLSSD